jgi:hypothetical protein
MENPGVNYKILAREEYVDILSHDSTGDGKEPGPVTFKQLLVCVTGLAD